MLSLLKSVDVTLQKQSSLSYSQNSILFSHFCFQGSVLILHLLRNSYKEKDEEFYFNLYLFITFALKVIPSPSQLGRFSLYSVYSFRWISTFAMTLPFLKIKKRNTPKTTLKFEREKRETSAVNRFFADSCNRSRLFSRN